MKKFKSSVSRLARLFQKSRDNWKEKALEKQKKVRALEIKVRDLSLSREQWKVRAKKAEKKLQQLHSSKKESEKKGNNTPVSLIGIKATR